MCSDAFQLAPTGGIVRGSTVGATNSSITTTECADQGTGLVGGVWYSIRPPLGAKVVASLCDGTNFDTLLVVFEDGCDLQRCGWSNKEGCGAQSILSWTAEGDSYLIYVCGSPGAYNDEGEFTLAVNVTGAAPKNDLCRNAIPFPSNGGVVSGSTLYATFRSVLNTHCRESSIQVAGGVWYTITPPAETKVLASLCDNADYGTTLAILTGGCDTQKCVASNEHGCYNQDASRVLWVANGSAYLMYVTGGSGYPNTGNFNLTVSIEGEATYACESWGGIEVETQREGKRRQAATETG